MDMSTSLNLAVLFLALKLVSVMSDVEGYYVKDGFRCIHHINQHHSSFDKSANTMQQVSDRNISDAKLLLFVLLKFESCMM